MDVPNYAVGGVPDPEVHEGHREVHRLLPLVGDGQVSNSQVSFLIMQKKHEEN
jgi:hypothetical protein